MPKEVFIPSSDEQLEELAPWLSGIYEVGKYMGIGRTGGSAYPQMTYVDSHHPDRISTLKELFGGSAIPKRKPDTWYLSGWRVAYLSTLMKPYAPSRKTVTDLLEEWDKTGPQDLDERLELAGKARAADRHAGLSIKDYLSLVKNPRFVAGVVDEGKSHPSLLTYRKRYIPRFSLTTDNAALVESLVREFRGGVEIAAKAGEERIIAGKTVRFVHDSFDWSLTQKAARDVFEFTKDHLIFTEVTVRALLKLG